MVSFFSAISKVESKKENKESYFPFFFLFWWQCLSLEPFPFIHFFHWRDSLCYVLLCSFYYFFLSFILLQYQNLFSLYYYQNLFGNIKNSFLFTFHSLFSSFGILFLEIGVFVILYSIDWFSLSRLTFLTLIGMILQIFFFSVNGMLIFQLNAVSKFDKLINIKDYPEMYQKGLYHEDEEWRNPKNRKPIIQLSWW